MAAVVKRGVRIYAIFDINGLTAGQRAAAVSKIIGTGKADILDQGLLKIGNSAARWLAHTEGTINKIVAGDQGIYTAVLVNNADSAAADASWASKILGRNLDELIATRIGPVFILAGIGLSIYFLATGEAGIALASDIVNIVSGSLMLFATIGQWTIAGEVIAADGSLAGIISVAGPLAVLAALAGVALMIYELFQKPPDPVQEFVDNYARPAGLAVSSQSAASIMPFLTVIPIRTTC